MYNGQITSNGLYKINGSFQATSTEISEGVFKYYSSQLSGYVTGSPSESGLVRNVLNGESFYSDSALSTRIGGVTDVTFVGISKSVNQPNCYLSVVSGQMYGNYGIKDGDYTLRLSGYSSQTYYPASIVASAGGSTLATVTYLNDISFTATNDVTVIATIKYRSFILGQTTASHGSVSFEKMNVTTGLWSQLPVGGSFDANQPIRAVVTMATGYAFVSVIAKCGSETLKSVSTLDGGKAQFSIGDNDNPSTNTISFELTSSAKQPYTNTVVFDSTKGSVTVNGVACTGSFTGYLGEEYTIAVTPSSGYAVSSIKKDGTIVSFASSYSFTHGNSVSQFGISFEAVEDDSVSVNKYVGDSTNSYGSESRAYLAGCGLTVTEHPTARGNKYDRGRWKFSIVLPSEQQQTWFFMALYVVGTDGKYFEKILTTSSTVEAYIGVDAKVIGVFYQKANEPEDVDQGDATETTGVNLYWWEEGSSVKTAQWKGRRNVFVQPISFSSVQLYANSYETASTVKVHQFQSPNESDSSVSLSTISITNQNARRIPVRRMEKYVELEVDTKSEVTQVSISTNMREVCRQNT